MFSSPLTSLSSTPKSPLPPWSPEHSNSPEPSNLEDNVSVPDGHVWLVLLQDQDLSFYLEIPLNIIDSLCLNPAKYLLFLGWCILGLEGKLTAGHHGPEVDANRDGNLCQKKYYYVTGSDDLTHTIDVEATKTRTSVATTSTETHDAFHTKLLDRDAHCVWTGDAVSYPVAMHIIPFHWGSEWFRLVVESRPSSGEDVSDLDDINDVRNGFLGNAALHQRFDPHHIAVLKTPNRILDTHDIPLNENPHLLLPDISYPSGSRYTLQRLVPMPVAQLVLPNNGDAAFKTDTESPKPSELLLHYNYGAAAIKCWGHGTEVLQNHAKPPHPPVLVPAQREAQKTIGDRSIAIGKCMAAQDKGGTSGSAEPVGGSGKLMESEGEAEWDADDVMLFFLLNTPAAKERHHKKVKEDNQCMEQWRQGVGQVSE